MPGGQLEKINSVPTVKIMAWLFTFSETNTLIDFLMKLEESLESYLKHQYYQHAESICHLMNKTANLVKYVYWNCNL